MGVGNQQQDGPWAGLNQGNVSLAMYCVNAVVIILLNKLVVHTHKIDFPVVLVLCQNTASLLLLAFAHKVHWTEVPRFSKGLAVRWVPVMMLFSLMLISSLFSLRTMPVAILTVIKNLALIPTAFLDKVVIGTPVTRAMHLVFALMVVGSFLGTAGDPIVTLSGLFWSFTNVFATVSYLIGTKYLLSSDTRKEMGQVGPVLYNNLLSLPFLLLLGWGDLPAFWLSLAAAPPSALASVALLMLTGALMSFVSFFCVKTNSPTTYSVAGALNKIPSSVLGMVLFNHVPSPVGFLGIALSLGAGVMYALECNRIKREEARRRDIEEYKELDDAEAGGGK